MNLLRVTALALVVFCAASLCADDQPDKKKAGFPDLSKVTPEMFLKRLDRNKDGFVSKQELPERLQRLFEQVDRNQDGKLDLNEVTELLEYVKEYSGQSKSKSTKNAPDNATDKAKTKDKGAKGAGNVDGLVDSIFQRLDTNKDGKISKAEAQGRPLAEAFERLDRNGDGYLDRTELRSWAEMLARDRAAGKGGPKGFPPFGPGGGQGPDFDALDKDADGRLSREELRGTRWSDVFDKIDANNDGHITRKEFTSYLKNRDEAAANADDTVKNKAKKN